MKSTVKPEAPPKPAVPVARIFANAIYTLVSARQALQLTESSLQREIRLRRLRVSRRAGRYFILGKWLLEWIEGGEKSRDDAGIECHDLPKQERPNDSATNRSDE